MKPGSLAILDVGHGSSVVLQDSGGTIVIDAGPRSSLLEFLLQEGIDQIDEVLISHADADHVAGLLNIATNPGKVHISSIHLNSDGLKGSKLWDDLVFVLDDLARKGEVIFKVGLTPADTGNFDRGAAHIEVLAPSAYLAAKGPGSQDRLGRKLTSNSLSAVFRISKGGNPMVLLCGDLDSVGLEDLIRTPVDATAPLLVFPHHGGTPGAADTDTFVNQLCDIAQSKIVVISLGRDNRYENPLPEIMAAIRRKLPAAKLLCTQLSRRCAAAIPTSYPSHLSHVYAHGRKQNHCCAGTIVVSMDDGKVVPELTQHKAFIDAHAPTALCTI